jgi:hypothetical protein
VRVQRWRNIGYVPAVPSAQEGKHRLYHLQRPEKVDAENGSKIPDVREVVLCGSKPKAGRRVFEQFDDRKFSGKGANRALPLSIDVSPIACEAHSTVEREAPMKNSSSKS